MAASTGTGLAVGMRDLFYLKPRKVIIVPTWHSERTREVRMRHESLLLAIGMLAPVLVQLLL